MSNEHSEKKSSGISAFKFILLIVAVVVVAPVMHQFDADPETLKIVGRACGVFAVVLTVWGLLARMFRFVGLILALAVGLSVLVSEGVIKPPKLMEKISEKREN